MAGAVIQAAGRTEFEDGLWIGDPLRAQNGLNGGRTIPRVQPKPLCTFRSFQSAEVCEAARLQIKVEGSIPGSHSVRI